MLMLRDDKKIQPQPQPLDIEQSFFNITNASLKLNKERDFVFYQIRKGNLFAVKFCGQWRVFLENPNKHCGIVIARFQNVEAFYHMLPEYLTFDRLFKIFKLRKTVVFELVYRNLISACYRDGANCIQKSTIVQYIETQNNFELEF